MNYDRVLSYIASKPWAIHRAGRDAIMALVAARLAGEPPADPSTYSQNFGGTPYFAEELAEGQIDRIEEAAAGPDGEGRPLELPGSTGTLALVECQADGTFYVQAVGSAIPGQTASAVARKAGRVAVLPIRGTILHRVSGLAEMSGATGLEQLGKTLRGLVDDNGVKAIVLDVDSLGGSVEGLPEFGSLIFEAREAKPIVSQVNARAASAGYWIASQAAEVTVTPSGDVGSIGVISMHQDVSEAYAKAGIKTTLITSSKFKAEGNQFEPLSDEARAAIQADVDAFDAMFVDAVARGRGVKAAEVRENFGLGRMVLAEEAVRRGMADRVATMEQTLNRFGASLHGRPARAAAQEAHATRRMAARRFLRRELLRAS